ncbi:6-phosphofructokinase, partial [Bacteroides fragilis]|nr:6-phosphofructokinase [Bacteroides fragilis]
DTAVSVATDAIDRLHTTAESHDRILIVEVMGRLLTTMSTPPTTPSVSIRQFPSRPMQLTVCTPPQSRMTASSSWRSWAV